MKKNEMIKIMHDALPKDIQDIGDIDYYLEEVLDAQIKAGLRQPSYQGLMRNGERFVREFHAGYDVMDVSDRWEPEDV